MNYSVDHHSKIQTRDHEISTDPGPKKTWVTSTKPIIILFTVFKRDYKFSQPWPKRFNDELSFGRFPPILLFGNGYFWRKFLIFHFIMVKQICTQPLCPLVIIKLVFYSIFIVMGSILIVIKQIMNVNIHRLSVKQYFVP